MLVLGFWLLQQISLFTLFYRKILGKITFFYRKVIKSENCYSIFGEVRSCICFQNPSAYKNLNFCWLYLFARFYQVAILYECLTTGQICFVMDVSKNVAWLFFACVLDFAWDWGYFPIRRKECPFCPILRPKMSGFKTPKSAVLPSLCAFTRRTF